MHVLLFLSYIFFSPLNNHTSVDVIATQTDMTGNISPDSYHSLKRLTSISLSIFQVDPICHIEIWCQPSLWTSSILFFIIVLVGGMIILTVCGQGCLIKIKSEWSNIFFRILFKYDQTLHCRKTTYISILFISVKESLSNPSHCSFPHSLICCKFLASQIKRLIIITAGTKLTISC